MREEGLLKLFFADVAAAARRRPATLRAMREHRRGWRARLRAMEPMAAGEATPTR